MKDANHLQIDKSLKKDLNKKLKVFRKFRVSNNTAPNKKESNSDFFGFLFKEYDSMNDLMKDLF